MALTNAGRDEIAKLIHGSGTNFANANARIGVGDATTAFAAADTDLKATTNKLRKAMDPGYPTISGNAVTFKSTFASAEANFAWNEWGVFNAASGGTLLNRVVETNGTKLSGQTWVFQVTLTINIGV